MLVTSWNPLKIWFYELCYIRFSGQRYDENDLNNRYIHLTNNSVQANANNKENLNDIPGNMWDNDQFSNYLKVFL